MKIALCPGHHQAKPGARNAKHNISENEVAKKIVLLVKNMLSEHQVDIIEGRLGYKVREINKGNYDVALDLHFNADAELEDTDNLKGYGCMVLHYPTSNTRRAQASKMSESIAKSLNTKNRGSREAWYWGGENPGTKADYFTDKTNCPAFIPEPGYIDNNKFSEEYLITHQGHLQIAQAIKEGIEDFE